MRATDESTNSVDDRQIRSSSVPSLVPFWRKRSSLNAASIQLKVAKTFEVYSADLNTCQQPIDYAKDGGPEEV